MRQPNVIKKYGNRRLYDTAQSRYVTLEEVAEIVRRGDDVRILDAKTNEDLTQATLAQIILESRRASALLPVPLLVQLIRLGDEALSDFIGRWISAALEAYLQAHGMAEAMSPYVPLATAPFAATNQLARLLAGAIPQLAGGGFLPQAMQLPAMMANAFPGFGAFTGAGASPANAPTQPPVQAPPSAPPPGTDTTADDVAELRRELAALRRDLKGGADRPARPRRRRDA